MQLTAQFLTGEIFSEAVKAKDHGFTLTKSLGTVEHKTDDDGNLIAAGDSSARLSIEMNAAAVRMLKEQLPELEIRYPQTVVSQKTTTTDDVSEHTTEIRTDAVIQVSDEFVLTHTGAAFRQCLEAEWSEQFQQLKEQMISNLRRYEMRTARMFSADLCALTMRFRVSEEMVESDIWTILLANCGLYPLQWDGEVCGMAMLLAEYLKTALADDCDTPPRTSLRRDLQEQCYDVVVNYSIKQD